MILDRAFIVVQNFVRYAGKACVKTEKLKVRPPKYRGPLPWEPQRCIEVMDENDLRGEILCPRQKQEVILGANKVRN